MKWNIYIYLYIIYTQHDRIFHIYTWPWQYKINRLPVTMIVMFKALSTARLIFTRILSAQYYYYPIVPVRSPGLRKVKWLDFNYRDSKRQSGDANLGMDDCAVVMRDPHFCFLREQSVLQLRTDMHCVRWRGDEASMLELRTRQQV